MDDILEGLNTAQRVAVTSDAEVLQVLAPPGSGKTKTLTTRVAHLITNRGLKPWNIIVCTFTVKAARDMKERIKGFIGEELEKKLKIGTFHGIALRYLRQYQQHAGLRENFGVADTSDSTAIVKRIVKAKKYNVEPNPTRGRISSQKAKGVDCEQYALLAKNKKEQHEFLQVFREYQDTLERNNLLDYDDILLRCVALLKSHPECVSNVQAVLVDEFQDTNGVQYELMGLFAQRREHITIVGDPDQSIYGWRSAEIQNLGKMKDRWPDTLTVNLEENYRSGGAILSAAQNIIEQDVSRPQKALQATHSFGQMPVLRMLPSARDEATWLVSEIQRLQALSGHMLQLGDFAILLRMASLSRVLEAALATARISYRMVGGSRFYDRVEVKIVLDYLRVINQPAHGEALERVLNVPPRKIGDRTIERLQAEAHEKRVTLWSLVMQAARGSNRLSTNIAPPAQKGIEQFVNVILCGQKKIAEEGCTVIDLIHMVLQRISYQDFLKHKYRDDHESRWANVEELVAQATDAAIHEQIDSLNNQPDSSPTGSDASGLEEGILSAFLANTALTGSADEKSDDDGQRAQQVTISTIHAAKGLEWPVVFMPACYDGSIPHSRSEDVDEERRLLYVGMTRAQAVLYLSCPLQDTQKRDTSLSSFLSEPGSAILFDEYGPSLPEKDVSGLAAILRRACPAEDILNAARVGLDRDEDNYWPLNGDRPQEVMESNMGHYHSILLPADGATRSANWAGGPTSIQQPSSFATGFTSVKSQYTQLMQDQEEAQRQRIAKRAESDVKATAAPKGSKRAREGQVTMENFLVKDEDVACRGLRPGATTIQFQRPYAGALPVLSSVQPSSQDKYDRAESLSLPGHWPRTEPLQKRQRISDNENTNPKQRKDYIFLSSSSKGPDVDETEVIDLTPDVEEPQYKAASTFHNTSMQSQQTTARRTLGVRRSLNGWASRGGKT